MKFRKASPEVLLSSCNAIGPDDGVDPRYDLRASSPKVANRKALQLCGQVARTLMHIFAGECGDERLQGLIVETVQPAPNSARLLVTVALPPTAGAVDDREVLQRLQRAAGMLRSEVAGAIHRRKTPELLFRIAPLDIPS